MHHGGQTTLFCLGALLPRTRIVHEMPHIINRDILGAPYQCILEGLLMHFEGKNSNFDIPKMRATIPDANMLLEHFAET